MKKLLYLVMISCFSFYLCDAVTASEELKFRNIVNAAVLTDNESEKMKAAAALNQYSYIDEVYASRAPDVEYAFRVFNAYEDIYLIAMYYTATNGNIQIYHVITNLAGQLIDLGEANFYASYGYVISSYKSGYPRGTYCYNVVIFTPSGIVMSTNGYNFIVE